MSLNRFRFDLLSSFDLFLTTVSIKQAHPGYNKNNNFYKGQISLTCVLPCSKELSLQNNSFECLKHLFRLRENSKNLRFGCLKGPSHRDSSF